MKPQNLPEMKIFRERARRLRNTIRQLDSQKVYLISDRSNDSLNFNPHKTFKKRKARKHHLKNGQAFEDGYENEGLENIP